MKPSICLLPIQLLGFFLSSPAIAQSGFTKPPLGNQYIYIEPSNTTIVAPQFLCPGTGILTEGGVTTNIVYGTNNNEVVTEQITNGQIATLSFSNNYAIGGIFAVTSIAPNSANYTLQLGGNPPLNSYGVPLAENQYQYSINQPTSYYALVTDGSMKGNFFTILSNTSHSITITTESVRLSSNSVKSINILPYWSLSSLFPASQATVSFIPTTNPSNVMSSIVIAPLLLIPPQQPQQVGQTYYFNAYLTNWVNVTNPNVPAGGDIVAPGQYVYFQNNGSNCYPLHEFISGTVLTNDFDFYFPTSSRNALISCFSLPRNSSYGINQIGFNDLNFTQSPSKSSLARKDQLFVDDGHGGVAAIYYRYKNQWYNSSSDQLPTNPVFAPGTAFGIMKAPTQQGTANLTNKSNIPDQSGASANSAFKGLPVIPVSPNLGNPSPSTNGGS